MFKKFKYEIFSYSNNFFLGVKKESCLIDNPKLDKTFIYNAVEDENKYYVERLRRVDDSVLLKESYLFRTKYSLTKDEFFEVLEEDTFYESHLIVDSLLVVNCNCLKYVNSKKMFLDLNAPFYDETNIELIIK